MGKHTILVLLVVDLSGSMQGQSMHVAQVQIQELLSQLQNAERRSGNRVLFGIIRFDTQSYWVLEPTAAESINSPPGLRIDIGKDGFYPRTSFVNMLGALTNCLRKLMPKDAPEVPDEAHVILISDGYFTDRDADLRQAINRFQKSETFDRSRCQFYMICDDLDSDQPREYKEWFVRTFTGSESNRVRSSDSASLTARIFGSILDSGHDPAVVF